MALGWVHKYNMVFSTTKSRVLYNVTDKGKGKSEVIPGQALRAPGV
jgi:hypothetical protein